MMGFFGPKTLEISNKAIINKSIIALAVFGLTSCGAPERLDQDVDVETTKALVKERIIAPLSVDNESAAILPPVAPRRQLLQLRYNQNSLIDPDFIDTLERLSTIYSGEAYVQPEKDSEDGIKPTNVSLTEDDNLEKEAAETDPFAEMKEQLKVTPPPEPTYAPISDEERERITNIRLSKRKDLVMREGLELEQDLFEKLRQIDASFAEAGTQLEATLFGQLRSVEESIATLEANRIPGVGETPPGEIFGRNLLRDADGYLSIPTDLTLMGDSQDGAVSSKIGILRAQVSNPEVRISFANLPLPDALRFIANTIDLQIFMSGAVEESTELVSINLQAGALSILDALLSQYNISILYDKDLEVAQIYTDEEFETRIGVVREAIENFNNRLFERRELARLKQEKQLLNELIDVARAIVYDYETETASSYSQDEVDQLLTAIPKNDDTFSKPLAEKRALEAIQRDKERLMDMIYMVQTLLTGDVDKFIEAVDMMPRDPGGEIITTTLNELTLKRLAMADAIEKYDAETDRALADRLVPVAITPTVASQMQSSSKKRRTKTAATTIPEYSIPIRNLPGFGPFAIEDPCIYDGREVFTEKVAVYGGESSITRIEQILDGYFEANSSAFDVAAVEEEPPEEPIEETPEEETPEEEAPAPATDEAQTEEGNTLTSGNVSADDLIPEVKAPEVPVITEPTITEFEEEEDVDDKPVRPFGCGETDPAEDSPNYVVSSDFSGFVVSGMISDIELFVRLVEEFDRPQRQVLIEVFMINVVKDFNRKLDLSFNTDAGATNLNDTDNFFLRRDLQSLTQNVPSSSEGGFVTGLISPNMRVQALVDFIETNNLGRTISSPTILVEEGNSAFVTRRNTKPVLRTTSETILDDNGNQISVPSEEIVEVEASFRLDVADVAINPNNNNVSLTFNLTDAAFESTLANVSATTGRVQDEISTKFVAAPGDVIVLAGLFKQSDSAIATGLPGTTTTGLPTAFLAGGEDNVGNKVEEMVILMAPTVIEPEIGRSQPNSAIKRQIGAPVRIGGE